MNPVLGAVLLACATGAVSAFVAYWLGRGAGEREARVARARLASCIDLNVALACQLHRLRARLGHLTPDELSAFEQIASDFGKESA